MSDYEVALAGELRRVRERQHADAVRSAHLEAALLRVRQGVPEGIIRATLESKSIVVLCRPVA